MALAPLLNLTQAQVVQQLNSGLHWFGPTISYSFPTTKTGLTGTSELNTFSALNANQQTKAVLALGLWDDLISPNFVTGTPGFTNIEFGNTRLAGVYAQTYYPVDGTVWFSSAAIGADLITPVIGNHGFLTYIHELGHALGLDHMGNYNGAGTFTPNSYQDSTVLSVMSYFGPSWGSGASNGEGLVAWADWVGADNKLYEPQTPMLNDIYAIQQIYGADPNTRIGNTVYGFHSTLGATSGGIYDFTSNLNPIMCLYDSSGIDTLDLSGWSTSSTISLVPGTFSSGNSMTNNISIAYSCVIENAVGGAGNDVLVGNDYNNTLNGGAGNDTLSGGLGNDILVGLAGADTFDGGDGVDWIYYGDSAAAVTVYFAYNYAQGGDATGDTFTNVENLYGTNFNDTLGGNTANNTIIGGLGNDVMVGFAGADTFDGGDGVDWVYYGDSAAAVTVYFAYNYAQGGDATSDTFANVENLYGTNFNDTLGGNAANNTIIGGLGNDVMVGFAGADTFDGGDGVDWVYYGDSAAAVTVYFAYNYAQGGDATGDTFANVENLYGTNFNDTLGGNAANNTIIGGLGNDIMVGFAGADTFDGGDGVDWVYYGDSGAAVTVDLTTGKGTGGDASGDTLISVENVWGTSYGDILIGNSSANTLVGFSGNDQLTGGLGNDNFIFTTGFGKDTITDFVAGVGTTDVIVLSLGTAFDTFTEILAASTQVGLDTVITISATDTITLLGVQKALLATDDFNFV